MSEDISTCGLQPASDEGVSVSFRVLAANSSHVVYVVLAVGIHFVVVVVVVLNRPLFVNICGFFDSISLLYVTQCTDMSWCQRSSL